ncbi:hypothetical protein [Gimesia chilikensis]|uniref:Uncharacterized protein n=1 Tax=Gimesia chilikensis TaxID=2605989 RepID=A0A517PKI1_9PLAN|nr:hypothetical protein [Gimesia chilikensis]QDT19885.1 hypothetical protein HG66A1_16530 [Gimesia chilikensis]
MGWTYPTDVSRKELIQQRTKSWQREINGVTVKSTCLSHCFRGGRFSGVLWAVFERTFEKGGEQVERTQRWITCDLIRCHGGDWGYKDMQEAEHPYYYSCPQKYLDLVPTEEFGGNAEWRSQVRLYHQKQLEKRRQKKPQGLTQ